jgi:hypothetical protein
VNCGNDPNAHLTDGDRQAIADFRAYLAARKLVAEYEATAAFVHRADGRPSATLTDLALAEHAHQLAEQQRAALEYGPGVDWDYETGRRLADLIDPKVQQ